MTLQITTKPGCIKSLSLKFVYTVLKAGPAVYVHPIDHTKSKVHYTYGQKPDLLVHKPFICPTVIRSVVMSRLRLF